MSNMWWPYTIPKPGTLVKLNCKVVDSLSKKILHAGDIGMVVGEVPEDIKESRFGSYGGILLYVLFGETKVTFNIENLERMSKPL